MTGGVKWGDDGRDGLSRGANAAAGRPREGAGQAGGTDGYGKLVTVLGVVLVGVTAPVVLITWLIGRCGVGRIQLGPW